MLHAMRRKSASLVVLTSLGFSCLAGAKPADAQSVACTGSALATGTGSTACGQEALASGDNSAAYGRFSRATATNSSAFGLFSRAEGHQSSAFGAASMATGVDSSAFGVLSQASGVSAVAVGARAQATADGALAVGASAMATGVNAIAIGQGAVATGSIAIGSNSVAGNGGTAIGDNTSATFSTSAAFGEGAVATRDNQQVFGTITNTYTMSGVASAASRAAQGAPTHLVTSNADGDLAAYTFSELGLATSGELGAINSRLEQIGAQSSKALSGVAMALAMAGTPSLLPSETFAMSINYGTFEGRHGVAFNTALRLHDKVQFTAGIGYGVNDRLVGGRAGLRFGW